MSKNSLITGQDGSYLADLLLDNGSENSRIGVKVMFDEFVTMMIDGDFERLNK